MPKETPKWMLSWRNRRKPSRKRRASQNEAQDEEKLHNIPVNTRRANKYPKRPTSDQIDAKIAKLPSYCGAKPNPCIDPRDVLEMPACRFYDCAYHSECLRIAGLGQWPGMTCEHCEIYDRWKGGAAEKQNTDLRIATVAEDRKEI